MIRILLALTAIAVAGCIGDAPDATFDAGFTQPDGAMDVGSVDVGEPDIGTDTGSTSQLEIPSCAPGQPCAVVWAGTGELAHRDGTLDEAAFAEPAGIAFDGNGNLFVADTANNAIRRITDMSVETYSGGPDRSPPRVDGPISLASFDRPTDLLITPDETIWVLECGGGGALRRIEDDTVRTVATGLGCARGLAFDGADTIYIAATSKQQILAFERSSETVSVTAGVDGVRGSADGPAATAQFFSPAAIGIGADGSLYIADDGNNTVRRIDGGTVSTFAGEAGSYDIVFGPAADARFNGVNGLTVHDGSLYVATNTGVSKIDLDGTPEVEPFVAPNFAFAVVEGPPLQAKWMSPTGIAVREDEFFVSSRYAGRIYALGDFEERTDPFGFAGCTGCYHAFVGSGHRSVREGSGSDSMLHGPDDIVRFRDGYAVTLRGGQYIGFVTDSGEFSILAGDGTCENRLEVGESGPPRDVSICGPTGLATIGDTLYAIGASTNEVFAITENSATLILQIPVSDLERPVGLAEVDGALYTASASQTTLFRIDVVEAFYSQTELGLSGISAIASDDDGNLYFPIVSQGCVHRIDPTTPAVDATQWLGSCGEPGYANGTKTTARIERPLGLAFASDGRIWVTLQDGLVEVNGDSVTHLTADLFRGQFYGPHEIARVNAPDAVVLAHDGSSLIMSETSTDRLTQWVF